MSVGVGEETGPVSGKPPPVANGVKEALTYATNSGTGQNAAGKDAGSNLGSSGAENGDKKVKSEKERT